MSAAPLPPPHARLGLIWPGLGHLAGGDAANGLGLMAHTLALWAAAIVGFPRLGALLNPPPGGELLHPVLALLGWVGAVGVCWGAAWRLTRPRDPHARRGFAEEVARQFQRNRVGVLGLHAVAGLALLALLTPLLAPHDPTALNVGGRLAAPQPGYWMGTDNLGRDVLSRVLYGARLSLSVGFVAVSLSATVGTLVGALAGYFGGWVDRALMWVVDLLLALPRLVLLLAIVGLFRTSGAQTLFLIVAILGLTGWMGVSRIVRAQVLSLREQDFVQAGRALGLSDARIVAVHILPNALAPVIVHASLAIGGTILTEASLSFLGLGVPPPTPTWGAIVSEGKEALLSAPWIAVFPGLFIVVAVMGFNLVGDGLRDALDPRLRGRE